jgi:transcriptional regulator with XRE-family HTH domain
MAKDVLFPEWLNKQLLNKHLTQADLAKATGLCPSTINKSINSKTKQLNLDSYVKIANALGMSPITVIRAALPDLPEPNFPEQEDLVLNVAQLPDIERQIILEFTRVRVEFMKRENAHVK